MPMSHVIVGAGEAGIAAAAAIRARDPEASIRVVTDEDGYPYERPPLSKEVLTGEAEPTLIKKPEWYSANEIDLVRAEATSIDADRRVAIVVDRGGGEQQIAYDTLLIATGAHARRLPYPGILYLRRWEDALAIRQRLGRARRVAILGGGVIGLELASSARSLGVEVVVIELGQRLMARALAPEISAWLRTLHEDAGVELRLGARVSAVEESESGFTIRIEGGGDLHADLVLAGIGATPETELARTAGCVIDDGVMVDASGRTSVAGIYAAGDGARFLHPAKGHHMRLEAWQHAGRHGAHVGAVMAGDEDLYHVTPWFWTNQHGINLQVAGYAAEADRSVARGDGAKRTCFHFRDDMLIAASTIDNARDMRPAIQLIEAGWTGDPAALADESTPLRAIVQAWRDRLSIPIQS